MRLILQTLEDRLTPAGFFLTGVGGVTRPAEPNVRTYDSSTVAGGSSTQLTPPGDIAAFPGFAGSVRIANGDVNGDGVDDIIAAQGPGVGSGSLIKIFDGYSSMFLGTAVEIASFYAYSNTAEASQTPGFGGGVFVAAGDFNHDGFDEVVVSAGAGARGHIKVFNFNDGSGGFLASVPQLRSSFYSYTDFAGEIRVTTLVAGPTTYLVTGSGAGVSQSDVRLYGNAFTLGQIPDLTFVAPAAQIFPFAGYKGGVSVAAGDTDGDGVDELFVSKNNGISVVDVFDLTDLTAAKYQFEAFAGFSGEVRLGAADVDGDGKVEVLTSTGDSPGAGGAHIKVWQIAGAPTELRSFFAYPGYSKGVFLGTTDYSWNQNFGNTSPLTVPDNSLTFTTSSLIVDPRTLADGALRPKSISVVLNITALTGGQNADLEVSLRSPNGTTFVLFTNVNGGGDGMQIVIADSAMTALASGTPPSSGLLTGVYRPETGSLIATFGPATVAGTWTLLIRDVAPTDTYQLTAWSLKFGF